MDLLTVRTIFRVVGLCGLLLLCGVLVYAQPIAFPGAEGYGKYAVGGRGGRVVKVTNLNDDGPGSLREAIRAKGPRIVVFTVSGTIELQSELRINNPNITIAGQSAPGDGICLKGYPFGVNADNVVIRFLRFRLGDTSGVEADAIGGRQTDNVIIDHCSISWATDECASFYHNRNFTMQWCLVSEPLNMSVHAKGAHGYAGIWGGEGASFHHNLLANSNSRNPRFSGSETTANTADELVDFRNNVIYNWGDNSVYGGEKGRYNMVNNYYKPGPATSKSKRDRIVNPSPPYGRFYVQGNHVEGSPEVTADNHKGGIHVDNPSAVLVSEAFAIEVPIGGQSAMEAYEEVLLYAGASLHRDEVDIRIVQEVRHGVSSFGKNGDGIIDSQQDVGGWPVLKGAPYPIDADGDGIPDDWELSHGLDPHSSNAGKRTLHPEYDDVEVYVNSLVEPLVGHAYRTDYDMVVAQDGSGDFTTVQEAIQHVPDMRENRTVIYIKGGVYKEKITLPPNKTNVSLIGEHADRTILTFDDYASKKNSYGEDIGTSGSASFFVFGDGLYAENITFENSAGPVGQAVAVRTTATRVFFNKCRFLGHQDTLYPHGVGSKQYYKDCYIEGTTDFIFGSATALFQSCDINCKPGGSYITAASTPDTVRYGFVFKDCRISGDAPEASTYLGRPWRPYAKTVFIGCYLGNQVRPEGWHNWGKVDNEKTAFYAEYDNEGAGARTEGRVNWCRQLGIDELAFYADDLVLGSWVPGSH